MKMKRFYKLLLIFSLVLCYLLLRHNVFQKIHIALHDKSLSLDADTISRVMWQQKRPLPAHIGKIRHDKWIVVTTISKPTPAVRMMAKIPGWKLVVVGDLKTPANWSLPGVVYLSPDIQERLGYSVLKHLRYISYCRKVVGYLYAIQHGAEYIYETDDDNFMHRLDIFRTTEPHENSQDLRRGLVVRSTQPAFNPYPHFGQISMWPRGYPLENIGEPAVHNYSLCSLRYTPSVQQGIVNGDPDVDAIYRMTRKHVTTDLDLTFDEHAPCVVLPSNVYSPYNSQNTFFTKRAFWSLLLFQSVTMRETDIVRSYWSQRLMWLIGEHLSFFAPITVQRRNAHSYNADARDELRLYARTEELIRDLQTWTCDSPSFFKCIESLTQYMVEKGYIETTDFQLTHAWIQDLENIGYNVSLNINNAGACYKHDGLDVTYFAVEQKASVFYTRKLITLPEVPRPPNATQIIGDLCNIRKLNSKKPDILTSVKNKQSEIHDKLLLVIINTDLVDNQFSLIDAYYRSHFVQIIYCLTPESHDQIVILMRMNVSHVFTPTPLTCVDLVIGLNYNVRGYFIVRNEFNVNLKYIPLKIDMDELVLSSVCNVNEKHCNHTADNYITSYSEFKTNDDFYKCLASSVSKEKRKYSNAHLLYIPEHMATVLHNVLQHFVSTLSAKVDDLGPHLASCLSTEGIKKAKLPSTKSKERDVTFSELTKFSPEGREHYCRLFT